MASIMWNLIIASALLITVTHASGSEKYPFYSYESRAESLAKAFCLDDWPLKPVIEHQSTILLLERYFSSLTPESEQAGCRELYLEPLQDLRAILETSSGNVCSKKKIDSIDKFHWDYIVGTLSKKWRKASEKSLPEPLRLFFMHYANEITELCKETLADRLEAANNVNHLESESLFATILGGVIDQAGLSLVPASKVTNYDSYFLIFNQMVTKERKKGHEFPVHIDESTKTPFIALAKVKDPRDVWAFQRKCFDELMPVYQETTLPVMKLLDMGYGRVDKESGKLVKDNKLIGNWYAITQWCEILVPVKFYKDDSMKPGELKIISPDHMDEVKSLDQPSVVGPEKAVWPYVKSVHLQDMLECSIGNHQLVAQVKANLKARSHIFRQIFKNMLSTMKSKFAAKLKSFFVSKLTKDNKYVKVTGDNIIKESEAAIKELVEDNEETTKLKFLIRNKREKREKTQAEVNRQVQILIIVVILVAIALFLTFAILTSPIG